MRLPFIIILFSLEITFEKFHVILFLPIRFLFLSAHISTYKQEFHSVEVPFHIASELGVFDFCIEISFMSSCYHRFDFSSCRLIYAYKGSISYCSELGV